MKKIFSLLFVTFFLFSCYPGGDVSVSDLDTVTTFYESSSFNPAPNSVIIYWNVSQILGDDGNDLPYDEEVDDEILNTTLNKLVALYGESNVYIYSSSETPSPAPSNPNVTIITPNDAVPNVDASLIPSIILRENTNVSIIYPPCLPDWWYWYCYPPYVDISSYSSGTVVLQLMDLRQGLDNPETAWTAYIKAVLSSQSSNSSRTVSGINQAFNQSPYLN